LTYLFFSLHWPMFTYSVFVIYILVQWLCTNLNCNIKTMNY
jgi:hypothetical protein